MLPSLCVLATVLGVVATVARADANTIGADQVCQIPAEMIRFNQSVGSTVSSASYLVSLCGKAACSAGPCATNCHATADSYGFASVNGQCKGYNNIQSMWTFNNAPATPSTPVASATFSASATEELRVTVACGGTTFGLEPVSSTFPVSTAAGKTTVTMALQSRAVCAKKATYWDCGCVSGNCSITDISESTCLNTIPFTANGAAGTKIDCQGQRGTCANLVFFSDNNCNSYVQQIAPACGSCEQVSIGGQKKYLRVNCVANTENVQVTECTDSTCGTCTGQTVTHAYDNCGPSLTASFSIVNRGVSTCSLVRVRSWQSSSTCAGAPTTDTLVAQDQCTNHGLFRCWARPALEAAAAGANVLMSRCAGTGCTSPCSYQSAKSGTCVAYAYDTNPYSEKITCKAASSNDFCAKMMLFNNPGCNDEDFETVWTGVCNKCTKGVFGSGDYNFLECSMSYSQDYPNNIGYVRWKTGCDATCSQCNGTGNIRPMSTCAPATPPAAA